MDAEDDEEEATALLEGWVDWIRRTTHRVEELNSKLMLEPLVLAQRRIKWKWAGHVARREDGRWDTEMLGWAPSGTRRAGHPCRRWADRLDRFFAWYGFGPGDWRIVAANRAEWSNYEDEFVQFEDRYFALT